MSVAAAEEISVGTSVATVLLELDGIFALQGEQRMAPKVFYDPPASCMPRWLWQKFCDTLLHRSSPTGILTAVSSYPNTNKKQDSLLTSSEKKKIGLLSSLVTLNFFLRPFANISLGTLLDAVME